MSTGLALIEGQLYVSRELLLGNGVPLNTVKAWRTSKRIEKQTLKSGLHFCYETLPEAARARLPYADADAARRVAVGAQAAADAQQATAAAKARPLQLTYDLRHAVETSYPALLPSFTHELSRAEAEPLARLQAALDWCLSAEGQAYKLAELVPAVQALGLRFCPTPRRAANGLAGAVVSLSRKLTQYRKAPNKTAYLLAARPGAPRGNHNAQKAGPPQVVWLVKEYGRNDKPTAETVTELYHDHAAGQCPPWPELSIRTVRNVLNENRPLWFAARHGMAAAKAVLGYKLTKQRPSAPDLLLEFDGTNDPLAFTDETGREITKLYAVRVIDMHSDCIVGSAYGFTETADLVLAALQDYLLRWRRVPQQFRFDQGAANMSQAVQTLLEQTGAVYFPSQAKRPTGRRSEQITGLFQKTVLRKLPWFRGANITSQRDLNLRPNPERLAQALKTPTTVAAVIAACRQCENEWNERRPGNRAQQPLTPLQRYTAGAAERPTLSLERLAALLYVKRQRPVRYTGSGLQIETAGGQTYAYEPQQANGDLDRAAHKAANGHRFEVWERRDGNREAVLVRREDGRGDWQEMPAKYVFSEALADHQPGEAAKLHRLITANDADLQADLSAALALEPADADAGQADLGLRLSKDDWNTANAAAELAHVLPSRQRPAGKPTPTLAPVHSSMCGADWNGGPTEGPPPSLALAT